MTRSYFKLNRNNKKELEKKSEVALPFWVLWQENRFLYTEGIGLQGIAILTLLDMLPN
jgi:hypothetical protein